jgi:FlaA1/EpsC-like NDP-sugar epimerase
MAQGGDVFVLDMGQPVRIADVARRMVHLSGLTVREETNPDGDIEIRYTGLRPGEKLYEELLIGDNVTGTEHPMIMRAMEHSLPWEEMQDLLGELVIVSGDADVPAVRDLLQRGVREYWPNAEVVDDVWCRRDREPPSRSNVTSLTLRRLAGPREMMAE